MAEPSEIAKLRSCPRTRTPQELCPCVACRAVRHQKHGDHCHCWLCFSDGIGEYIDKLGQRTQAGRWLWFLTLTYRTPHYPWARGFPIEQPAPSPDFAHHFFARMIHCIEGQVHSRVEYFVADQYGEMGGRLHQHCGLSWLGLFEYRWKLLQEMLWKNAGFNRILPWKEDAGYYIGRYIGRDAHRSHWDFRVGLEPAPTATSGGRIVVARSADLPSRAFRSHVLRRWHR